MNDVDSQKRVERLMGMIELGKKYSEQDECFVTNIICSVCGKWYDEELIHARTLVVCGLPFTCLSCDNSAHDGLTASFNAIVRHFLREISI